MENTEKDLGAAPHLLANKKKSKHLIDAGLMHYEASVAGFTERYRRGETPHTIHVWWARRPHSAMRALAFASLCRTTNKSAVDLMSRLGSESLPDKNDLMASSRTLLTQYGAKPKVLDMFGGGGTIPFEAGILGADSYSIDANQLAVFIQRSLLTDAVSIGDRIQERVLQSGTRVLEKLKEKTDWLYPQRAKSAASPLGYFWSYELDCESCQKPFLLLKRPWISRKKGRNLAFVLVHGTDYQDVKVEKVADDYKLASNWSGRNGQVECPHCHHIVEKATVKNARDKLIAACLPLNPGKSFRVADENDIPNEDKISKEEQKVLGAMGAELPSSLLPKWSGIVNPALYGMDTHSDFLNPRQRLVLLSLIQELNVEFQHLETTSSKEEARAVIGILSSLIDQLVDWNCRLSMWISQNEQVGRAFCGPGVAMMWEYFEIDPLSKGPANLWKKLDRIVEGLQGLSLLPQPANVQHATAQNMPFPDAFFDAIVTDPPYYDNIFYSVLADFFYSWKRLLLANVAPELFAAAQTDTHSELVASTFRSGNPNDAHFDYVRNLSFALNEAARTLKPDGVFSFVYSHSSLRGWLAIVESFRGSEISISSVQPLSIERKARPRAMRSEAVNTCVTFVGRKGVKSPAKGTDILVRFKHILESPFATGLKDAGWATGDISVALFAQGVGLLANCSELSDEMTDEEVLAGIEVLIQSLDPAFKIQKRGSI